MKKDRDIDFTGWQVREKNVRLRVFLIVLAVIFAGALSFVIILARNDFDINLFLGTRTKDDTAETETLPPDEDAPMPGAAAAPFTDENAVNVLFFCADDGKLDFCLLASFSKEENAIRVKPVTPQSDFSWNGRNYTLKKLYEEVSASAVAAALQDKGVRVSRYVDMGETAFKQIMGTLGEVEVNVPRDVSYKVNGITYDQKAGMQTMKGDALLHYMTHAFEGDERYRAQGEAFAAVLRTHFTEENLQKGEEFFTSLLNHTDTDISVFDYANKKDAVSAFLQAAQRIEVIS